MCNPVTQYKLPSALTITVVRERYALNAPKTDSTVSHGSRSRSSVKLASTQPNPEPDALLVLCLVLGSQAARAIELERELVEARRQLRAAGIGEEQEGGGES